MTHRFADAIADAALDTQAAGIEFGAQGDYRLVQCTISAAASVVVQGRLAPDQVWADLHTFTESGIASILMAPQMRLSITGNTGTVTADAAVRAAWQ